ncbi:MAG TPA: BLUF domain-containing protein [Polyangiaceae bacterium]|nr:BLUF domain-containing protein [Polyangiaceae bacterium]
MENDVQQLIYVSAARQPFDEEQLRALLLDARRRNQAAGVSGLLLHERGSFLQMLEGPKDAVTETFERISKDRRHHRLVLVYQAAHEQRVFADWSMGFVSMSPATARMLPGYHDFFRRYSELAPSPDSAVAQRILSSFRAGRWHALVD